MSTRARTRCGGQVTIYSDEYGNTPLHYAARYGYVLLLSTLVARAVRNISGTPSPIFIPNPEGWSPLHEAVRGGHVSRVVELCKYSIEVQKMRENGHWRLPSI